MGWRNKMSDKTKTAWQDYLNARKEITAGIAKTKKGFGYFYAPLDEVYNHVKSALENNNIVYLDKIINNETHSRVLETSLIHTTTGETIVSTSLELPVISDAGKMSLMQAEGANITYARRYNIQMLLGVVGEEDTDASPQEGQKPTYNKPVAFKPKAAPAAVNKQVQSPPVDDCPPYDDMATELNDSISDYDRAPLPEAIKVKSSDIGDKTHSIKNSAYLEQIYNYCKEYGDPADTFLNNFLATVSKGYTLSTSQVTTLEKKAKALGYGS